MIDPYTSFGLVEEVMCIIQFSFLSILYNITLSRRTTTMRSNDTNFLPTIKQAVEYPQVLTSLHNNVFAHCTVTNHNNDQ